MNRLLIALFAGFVATACSSGSSSTEDDAGEEDDGSTVVGEGDPSAITIDIESPERGTLSDATQMVVTGRVTSSAGTIDAVTVNGGPATLSGDRFEVTLPLTEGITLIETVARDSAGNEAIDARGVLAGTLVDQATPVTDGVVANVSSQAMTGLTTMVSDLANSTDFNSLFDPNVPVVDTGDGCNDAKVFVENIQLSGVEVGAGNAAGAIEADISVRDLVVTGRVNFEALCVGGSASFTMTANSYDVEGAIIPGIDAGDITVGINITRSDFANFNIDVDNVPGFIESLFEGQVRTRVADTLRDTITSMIPPVVNSFLGDFLAESISVDLLGQTIELDITPAEMNWTAQGGTIALDTTATVAGVEGARYLSSPRPRPSDADLASTGLRVALADDVLNQLLANIWASGALEDTMLPVPGDALSAVFGADVGMAALTLILPPVANFDTTTGTARLTVGDLMLEAVGTSGEPLASFVISADIDLAVETSADGTVRIITRAPRILAQVLSQSDTLAVELTNDTVAAIAELAITQISLLADDLLENLPVPGIAGATITQPTIQPAGGYLLLGGELAFE
jgi:hypothetical protein